ncbi:MAG: hypothetical protein IKZ56_02000 [Bacteroidales bacterium]|nr:hypothetical protein [Bacteroidales bacterium]
MDTIFEQDKHMLTFMEGVEKGESDFLLGIDNPTRVYKAKFEKNEDDNFILKFSVPEGDDFDAEYFFSKPAVLFVPNKIQILLLNTDALRFTQTFNEKGPQEVKVTYKSFGTEVNPSKWKYSKHCAYIRYSKEDFRYTDMSLGYDMTTDKNQHSSWKNAFLIRLAEDNNIIVSFEERLAGDDAYCVFRAQKKMDVGLFEKTVEAVRIVYGLLAGYSFADRGYFISDYTGEKPKERIPLIVRYHNREKAKKHKYPLLDKSHYVDDDHKQFELTTEQMNALIKLLIKNEELARAAKLLIEASAIDGTSKGVLAVVALETIANQLVPKGPAANVIMDKAIASQLNYELNKGLKKIKEKVTTEDYKKLESKVNSVNNLPNAVKLESVFEQLGLVLDDEEKDCISSRNQFLHGWLPKNKKLSFLTEHELVFMVSQRLIMLTAMLLLKKAGYGGMVNDWGYTEVVKLRAISEGRPLRQVGNAHRVV